MSALSGALDHFALLVAQAGATAEGITALKVVEEFCAAHPVQQPAPTYERKTVSIPNKRGPFNPLDTRVSTADQFTEITVPVQQPAAVVGQEPVGELVLFGADCKEVAWAKGKMPDVGTKLYTATVPAAGVQGDTKPRIATEDSAQEILEAKLWEFLDLAASFPGINLGPRTWQHVMVYAPVLHNPHTGKLRDLRDVESDPKAILCTGPDEKLKAAQQPDSERDACPNCKGTGHRHEPSGEKLPCDLCETEDSGRDAALVESIDCEEFRKLADAYHCVRRQEDVEPTYDALFQFVDKELERQVMRALAAHPAPSSDAAALWEALYEMREWYMQHGNLHHTDILSKAKAALSIPPAAHPANGAQSGLSDDLGDVIKGEIRSAYTEGYGHGKADGDRTASRFVPGNVVAECWTAILAAAKKGT